MFRREFMRNLTVCCGWLFFPVQLLAVTPKPVRKPLKTFTVGLKFYADEARKIDDANQKNWTAEYKASWKTHLVQHKDPARVVHEVIRIRRWAYSGFTTVTFRVHSDTPFEYSSTVDMDDDRYWFNNPKLHWTEE